MADSSVTAQQIANQIEEWRNQIFDLRGEITDFSFAHQGIGDHLDCVRGLLTCGLVALWSVRETFLRAVAHDHNEAAKSDTSP